MHILVSNDDGVEARGIQILQEVLRGIADITVVAPDRDRSAASNSLTVRYPLRIRKNEKGFIGVEGTPTDSVHLALTALLDVKPDMVVAGVNHGANLGDDTLYSGTVAAAMEGAMLGYPAIAVSLAGQGLEHLSCAAEITKQVILELKSCILPKKCLLNINVPNLEMQALRGIEVTRLGSRHCAEPTFQETDPRGNPIYWIGPPAKEEDAGPGTDFNAIREGKVSITPLQMDLTHYQMFDQLSGWLKKII